MQNPEDSYTASCESKNKIKQTDESQWPSENMVNQVDIKRWVRIHGSLSKPAYKLLKLSSS